ncbi:ribosomal L1 domain-containing protein [Rossellomorea vietnamensis]|uniref:Ribosomal L1 domain-containing protein n=1 Tax=Rossellomorea vietnamensis TaxID=218284 RepID=A0ACD4C319_9BACI|nr:ribosomal L1 domain-containing protein [Rossellomorea vietnamensis]UXH43010.1 ribosomal L1 domain-containing protein [Rossellomorea vietnamensis]
MTEKGMSRGQPITFRLPSDTPDHVLKHLQKLKEKEKRNFSSKIAELVLNGVNDSIAKRREAITIPLPKGLDKSQRDWLKHEHSEALLGSIVYQLLSNPVRTASLLASLSSNSLDIDEALYLQEESAASHDTGREWSLDQVMDDSPEEAVDERSYSTDEELDNFDWDSAMKPQETVNEDLKEESMDDLLGDFLAQMNK